MQVKARGLLLVGGNSGTGVAALTVQGIHFGWKRERAKPGWQKARQGNRSGEKLQRQ